MGRAPEPSPAMPPPAQVGAAKVAAKAAKRAARQSAGGLPAGAEELEALGWTAVDDDVRAVFDAAEAGGRGSEGGAAAAGSDWTSRGGWRAVEADAAALLTGATEYGFVSLEVLDPRLVFDAASLSAKKGKKKGAEAEVEDAAARRAAAAPPAAPRDSAEPKSKKARKVARAAETAAGEPQAQAGGKVSAAAPQPRAPREAAQPPPPAGDAAAKAMSKTKRRRELRKKQLKAAAAIVAAGGVPSTAAPRTPSAGDDDDDCDGDEDDDDEAVGTLKPPSSKKRKRAAAAAAAAAAAPEAGQRVDVSAWEPFGLHPSLLAGLAELGFAQPTAIQRACLPGAIAEGRDVIGAAATGSGKTLAFGLPILQALAAERTPAAAAAAAAGKPPPRVALAALVLCPTRELALQVSAHLTVLGRGAGVRVAAIVGGISPEKQARMLRRGPSIVVGTPGRLWELISGGEAHLAELHRLRFLVLDEADRMVEKGHFAELRHIMDAVETRRADSAPQEAGEVEAAKLRRQTFVFSATLTVPPALRKRLRLSGPAPASGPRARQAGAVGALLEAVPFCGASAPLVADVTDASRPVAPRLEEAALEGSMEERDAFLVYLLTRHVGRAIIFCNAISTVRRVAALLATLRLPAVALHASQQQRQRLSALDRFRSDAACALVATDVAARGLDVAGVRTVIHYQVPPSAELYVHRSGRTARAAADGLAVTLVTPGERTRYSALCRALGRPNGLPPFPVEPAAMAAARRRAVVAAKLDVARHARDKRRGDAAWMRKHAAELEIELSEEEDEAEDEDNDGAAKRKAGTVPSKRERELQAQLDALLAQPLGARLGAANATGSRRFPTFHPVATEDDAPAARDAGGKKKRGAASAAAAAATEGQDALAAVRAKARMDKRPRL